MSINFLVNFSKRRYKNKAAAVSPAKSPIHMPTAPDNFKRALQNDFEFWADNADQLNERFNAWLTK